MPQIQKQIQDECEEYERAAGYNVVQGSYWDNILGYLNGMRYCKSCLVYRKSSVENPNQCPVCNRRLQKWSRRMENKILYHDLDKDRIKALQRLSERMGWNGMDGRLGSK